MAALVAACPRAAGQEAVADTAARAESLLALAEVRLTEADTAGAESAAAAAFHAARGKDVRTYLAADRLLLAIANARSATDPERASTRYRRLTGRAEAESLLALDLERRRDELRRTELVLGATDVDSLRRQLGGAPAIEDSAPHAVGRGGDRGRGADPGSPASLAGGRSETAGRESPGRPPEEGGAPRVLLVGAAVALVGSLAVWCAARRRRRAAVPTRLD